MQSQRIYCAAMAHCCQGGGEFSGRSAMGHADKGIVWGGQYDGVCTYLCGTGASKTPTAKPTAFDVNVAARAAFNQ